METCDFISGGTWIEGNGLALTETVPLTTSTGAGGFATTGSVSAWAGGCVAARFGLALGVCDATVVVGGCGDEFEAAGEGELFTAEFEAGGAVTGGAVCVGRIS